MHKNHIQDKPLSHQST